MNLHNSGQRLRQIARWASLACTFFIAASTIPAAGAGVAASVTVDQVPLTVQQQLPPNIMLMLDDSGSMTWDVMPDYSYLSDTSQDGLTASSVNGVYFNPTVTYSVPPQADGTSYTTPSFSSAPINGFDPTGTTVDIAQYRGQYDSYNTSYYGTVVPYSVGVAKTGASTYKPTGSCPSNTALSGGAQPGYCYYTDQNNIPTGPVSFFDKGNGYFYVSRCNSVGDIYQYVNGGSKDICTPGLSFFIYTTTNSGGGYTRHYVGENTGDCTAAGLASSVCDDSDSVRQNVANWFSYYHTRILMAKSGLMTAFAGIDPTFRVGFGSINNNNKSGLPSPKVQYGNNYIAQVQPFGAGGAGTQKASFWSWTIGESPGSSTPLRKSLDAVGQYYQTSQPWQTSSSDTTELACRQAYTILTTDGFWNGSDPSNVGDVDGNTGTKITGPNSQSYTYSPVLPYSDGNITTSTSSYAASCPRGYSLDSTTGVCSKKNKSDKSACDSGDSYDPNSGNCLHTTTTGSSYSNTLADVAMKYWQTDLRTSTDNEVPTSTEDPAFWQHMTTFTLGLGFTPQDSNGNSINMTKVFNWANGGAAISGFSWPKPTGDSLNNIADLAHAAVNGHGGFYSATSPQAFSSGITDALKRVSERIGSGASLAANSTKLDTGTTTYQAIYYTGQWYGDIKALAVNPSTGAIATTPSWTASGALPEAASRVIKTTTNGSSMIDFVANASLTAAQKTALGADTATQNNVINYLRGDATNEQRNGGNFRNRVNTPLGDIVDSQPVYVGAPNPNLYFGKTFTGASSYASFAASKATRTPLLWVAANDGMLHGFNAAASGTNPAPGQEVFAYLPSAVILDGIKKLSDPNYGGNSVPHEYFNDGELTVGDVYYDSNWHTVLVGTTGRGLAKAVYALDVTDPSAPTLLWEHSSADSNYIGQIVGKPVIAQTADGTWSVLIGNGYNSTSGTAALLQFNIKTGTLGVYTTNSTTGNGLAQAAVWMANATNGVSTTAYAGDLNGNVWSFDLTASSPGAGTIIFTAKDGTSGASKAQPITAGLLAGKDPNTGNVWLFFGTGRYLTQSELADTSTQTWYGIIVQSSDATLVTNLTTNGRAALAARYIAAQTAASGNTLAARGITTPTDGDMVGKSGWYIDLLKPPSATKQGERMVTPNQFQGSLLLGTSRVPVSSDPCNPSGSGWIMAIDPFTGAPPAATFFDINNDDKFDNSDKITSGGTTYIAAGVGFNSVPNNPIFVGNTMLVSFDNASTGSVNTKGTIGLLQRLSWRELIGQ